MSTPSPRPLHSQRGATLIEVLVALIILMVGLLGLIGVMIQSQRAQLESYQRAQAMLLVQDMAARINSNRRAADCYGSGDTFGTDKDTGSIAVAGCAVGGPAEIAAREGRATIDLQEWNDLLLGTAETDATGNVGAMLGARGCITKDAATGVFQISVAWQGSQAAGAPPAGITCGTGSYGADDAQRRAVSITVLPAVAS